MAQDDENNNGTIEDDDFGTEELDRAELLRRLQRDSRSSEPSVPTNTAVLPAESLTHLFSEDPVDIAMKDDPPLPRDTEQHLAITEATLEAVALINKVERTKAYEVPEYLRESHATAELPAAFPDEDTSAVPTTPFRAVRPDVLEFDAVLDSDGKIAVPLTVRSALPSGARLRIVLRQL